MIKAKANPASFPKFCSEFTRENCPRPRASNHITYEASPCQSSFISPLLTFEPQIKGKLLANAFPTQTLNRLSLLGGLCEFLHQDKFIRLFTFF